MGRYAKPVDEARKRTNPSKRSKADLAQAEKCNVEAASAHIYELEKPDWLIEEAIEVWEQLAPLMVAQSMLTALDAPIFASYCQAVGTAVSAERVLQQKGPYIRHANKTFSQRPELKLREQAWKQAEKLAKALGLTPQARKAMHIYIKKPPDAAKANADKRKSWILGKR